MKVEIGGDDVTYYFKDTDGETVKMNITESDKECISRQLDRGETKGKLIIDNDTTLHWKVEY